MTVLHLRRVPAGMLARVRMRAAARERQPLTTSAALLMGTTGILLVLGLVMILSSSWVSAFRQYGSSFHFFGRQMMWAALGVAVMAWFSRIDYRVFRKVGYAMLAVSVVGMVLVLIPGIGTSVGGSSRWIGLGFARFQPSELAKLALVLAGADLCVRKGPRLRTLKEVMVPVGWLTGGLIVLIMLQPDLGTTLIVALIAFTLLYVGGARMRILTGGGLAAVGAFAALSMSAGYRRERVLSFLNPFGDPLGSGYQSVQSQIALGSGGLFGVGLGASRQKWSYVPNAHTDFIFSIIGEEMGLIGTFFVIAMFTLLAYAGIRVARRAPDRFGRIVAASITVWILGQAVINMGAVTGLLPITGVPLPLVSFGGSALVFSLAAIGILINIARQEVWPPSRDAAAEPSRGGR